MKFPCANCGYVEHHDSPTCGVCGLSVLRREPSEQIKVGFTGTREGMTGEQAAGVSTILDRIFPVEFHHGDCIGADEQAHGLAFKSHGCRVKRVGHPPINEKYRAFCEFDETREPKGYHARNREIVRETDVLIAATKQETEPDDPTGGTWYTILYARGAGRPIYVVPPSGRILNGRTMQPLRDYQRPRVITEIEIAGEQ